jgi:endonuclease I
MPKKTAMLCALLFSAFVCLGGAAPAQAAGNTTNDSFNKAKRMLERQVYADHMVTIYCGYRYGADKKVEVPDSFSTPRFLKRLPRGVGAQRACRKLRKSLCRMA